MWRTQVNSNEEKETVNARVTCFHLAPCVNLSEEQRCTLDIAALDTAERVPRLSPLIGFERHPTHRDDENIMLTCVTHRVVRPLFSDESSNDDESESDADETKAGELRAAEDLRVVVESKVNIKARDLAVALSARDITTIGAFLLGMERAQIEETRHWAAKPVADEAKSKKLTAVEQRAVQTATIKAEFDRLDSDKSGHLDHVELRTFLTDILAHAGIKSSGQDGEDEAFSAAPILTPGEINEFVEFFMNYLDADDDGDLTADEFCRALPRRPLEQFVDLTVAECTCTLVDWVEEPDGFVLSDGTLADNFVYYPKGAPELKFWEHYLEQTGVQPDSLCGQPPALVQQKMTRAFAGRADLAWLKARWKNNIVPRLPQEEQQYAFTWDLEEYESVGGLALVDLTQEIIRYLSFWKVYEDTTGLSRTDLGQYKDKPQLVQRIMVRTFGSYAYAKYCWEKFVAPQQADNLPLWNFNEGAWRFRTSIPPGGKLRCMRPNILQADIVLEGLYVRIKDQMLSHTDTRLQVGLEDIALHYKASDLLVVDKSIADLGPTNIAHMSQVERTAAQNMSVALTICAEYHNPACGNREPIIEHWSPTLHYVETKDGCHTTIHDDQVLMINLTAAAMPLLFSITELLLPVMDPALHFSTALSGGMGSSHETELVSVVRLVNDGAICLVENATGYPLECCIRKLSAERNNHRYTSRRQYGEMLNAKGMVAQPTWTKVDTEAGEFSHYALLGKPNSGSAILQRNTKDKWIFEAFDSGKSITDVLYEFGPVTGTQSEAAVQMVELARLLHSANSETSKQPEVCDDLGAPEPICKVDFLHARAIYNERTGRKLITKLGQSSGFGSEIHVPLDYLETGKKFAFPVSSFSDSARAMDGHSTSSPLLIAEATITPEGETKLRLCSHLAVENGTKKMMEVQIVCREKKEDQPLWLDEQTVTDYVKEHQRRVNPGNGNEAFRHTFDSAVKAPAEDPDSWVYFNSSQHAAPTTSAIGEARQLEKAGSGGFIAGVGALGGAAGGAIGSIAKISGAGVGALGGAAGGAIGSIAKMSGAEAIANMSGLSAVGKMAGAGLMAVGKMAFEFGNPAGTDERRMKQPLPRPVPPGWRSHGWYVCHSEGTVHTNGWEGLHEFCTGDDASISGGAVQRRSRAEQAAQVRRKSNRPPAAPPKLGEEKVRQRRWGRLCTPTARPLASEDEDVVLVKILAPGERMNGA